MLGSQMNGLLAAVFANPLYGTYSGYSALGQGYDYALPYLPAV